MERFTMYPVAFITTVQPWIAAWVLAISFFLTLLVVALVSRGRTARQVATMFALGYVATVIVVALTTSALLGFQAVQLEVVSVEPRSFID